MKKYAVLVCTLLIAFQAWSQQTIQVFSDPGISPIQFATREIQTALTANGQKSQVFSLQNKLSQPSTATQIVISRNDGSAIETQFVEQGGLLVGELDEQAYAIRRTGFDGLYTYWVFASDNVGAMYGGLRLAEIIKNGELAQLQSEQETPYVKRRGLKFNLSLDSRIPSFSDNGTNAYLHRDYVWDINFWRAWLDDLARYRYNFLSLWNRHPFPALIKMKEYPDVALDDVYSGDTLIKKMTIDEKIAMWQEVIRHAKNRGIDITWFTWNIHLDHATKYGLKESAIDPNTIAYMKEATKELFRTYPELHGIGITAGEQMRELKNDDEGKEKWLFDTYGKAMLEIAEEQPERKFFFIHRYWQTQFSYITDHFKPLIDHPNIDFDLSFKYSRARMHSSPNPTFADKEVLPTLPSSLRIWWNVRNDDIFTFRWGDADYVRSYIMNMPPAHQTAGFHMGSDKFAWGRETALIDSPEPRALQTQHNWYNFMLWGRLGYNPALANEDITKIIATKFPDLNANAFFNSWTNASKAFPMATKFHWHSWAYMWHVELCSGYDEESGLKYTSRFYDVLEFMDNDTMQDSGLMKISDYADAVAQGKRPVSGSPIDHAQLMIRYSNQALAELPQIGKSKIEEANTIQRDMKAMAHAGLYYGHKIQAATYHALFLKTNDTGYQQQAIQHMLRSYKAWEIYIDIFRTYYDHQEFSILNRVVDYDELLREVQEDVKKVGGHYQDKLLPL